MGEPRHHGERGQFSENRGHPAIRDRLSEGWAAQRLWGSDFDPEKQEACSWIEASPVSWLLVNNMIQIKVNIDELVEVTATRNQNGLWHVVGHSDDDAIDLADCTDEQIGAMMHLCLTDNPSNRELDNMLYEQLTHEQKPSGLVP